MGKILLAEDKVHIRNGLLKILKQIDNSIIIYEPGSVKKSLSYIQNEKIDTFILDIQLEDGDGYELAKKIRMYDEYKLTPIIFITAFPANAMMAFEEIHCYSYITKPFDEKRVIETFETIIFYGIKNNEKPKIKLSLKRCDYFLEHSDILFIESTNKKIYITTKFDVIKLSKTSISKLLEKLSSEFIRCHRSFVVNSSKIVEINKANKYIVIKGIDEQIPIGRKYITQFNESFY